MGAEIGMLVVETIAKIRTPDTPEMPVERCSPRDRLTSTVR
jgi:hypothetical protein